MLRRTTLIGTVIVAMLLAGAQGAAAHGGGFTPGAPGLGDPYFPLDGNGGYDVRHYDLDVRYTPATDVLAGTATISARATQNLSAFNLDFEGLTIRSLTVDGAPARFTRDGAELTVVPRRGLPKNRSFTVVVRYDGVPQTINDPILGTAGVFHTDDGMVIAGQPDVAATWFPVNDHPTDKASYTIKLTVPKGLEAVANGALTGTRTRGDWTTWTWDAREPMASYLVTANVGEFRMNEYRSGGVRYWDAVDPDLYTPPAAPSSGESFALSGGGEPGYRRLTRTLDVPAGGATLGFDATVAIEGGWDFFLVEARTPGQDDWTTLPDANGHTSTETHLVCAYAPVLHPFLLHYVTPGEEGACASATGTTGEWHAATGSGGGVQEWSVDLGRWAGGQVEVSLTYVNDDFVTSPGVFIDDVVVSTGQGSTGFEADGDVFDGWTPGGPPEGSPPNPAQWTVGDADDITTTGDIIDASFARQPEIVDFLSDTFGPYPFRTSGGIVDDLPGLGFALETQTRPIYSTAFFSSVESGADVIVHELAHQWYGDSVALARWQDIWLNEGFASYAEWLWSEREGNGTTKEIFANYAAIPAESEFWRTTIGDPGPERLFDGAVYTRGAMTLQALRDRVGDAAFFRILRGWATTRAGGNVTTPEFIAYAERVSGQQLDDLFQAWLFTPAKPAIPEPAARAAGSAEIPELLRPLPRR
ncbi:hypothetical protein J2S41_002599 [Catenuloplanes atrovinosus]|uniref:Membrane alanyl aminopeptidase n=1 Tax=Catenuloplanes atrovinosus TaxID=137266 RepID=A0AAE3YNU7_9ACTN|nr:M1 family aminopeptidase [Catenuloplanes atrovinosus]MDR7275821.1 hypothetical protein [Catenuloplanes atrovinosus]